jgi:hypothetical protein
MHREVGPVASEVLPRFERRLEMKASQQTKKRIIRTPKQGKDAQMARGNRPLNRSNQFMVSEKDITERVLIKYPRFEMAYNALQDAYDGYQVQAQPSCTALLGCSGAGKSTVGMYFLEQHPQIEHEGWTEYLVLFVTVPPQVTPRSFAAEMLTALKDPFPSRGTTADLGRRIDRALGPQEGGHRVRLVILNECQRFADSRWVVLYETANFLRERIETSGSAFVLLGLEYGSELIDENDQLQRLFDETILIEPFSWANKRDQDEFRGILKSLSSALSQKYEFPDDLTEPDLAFRLWYASFGLIGYLMKIIRGAAALARKVGSHTITRSLLAKSYIKHIREKNSKQNPITDKGFTSDTAPALVLPRDKAELRRSTAHKRSKKRAPRLSARTAAGM